MPDTSLPRGMTCGDCAHYRRCEWLIRCDADNTECDFAPSRFRLRAPIVVRPEPEWSPYP